jgi:hypothetical protein
MNVSSCASEISDINQLVFYWIYDIPYSIAVSYYDFWSDSYLYRMMNKYSSMSFLSKIRRKKSKDESLQGKRREEQEERQQTTKSKERINEPVRCETCGTDFSSLQDFERHAREDHPDMPSKPRRRDD